MLRARFGWMLVLSTALMMHSHLAFAEAPTVLGTWTGTVAQNAGKSNYTVVMREQPRAEVSRIGFLEGGEDRWCEFVKGRPWAPNSV